MNTIQIARSKTLPRQAPLVNDSTPDDAWADWLYSAVEELLRGDNVSFQRRMHKPQGISAEDFALAVDEYVNNRLADNEVHTPALGWLLITTAIGHSDKTAVAELLGDSDHPLGKLGEIAESLLLPLVDDALTAKAGDEEL
jgi:hypothetical protein